MNRTKNSTRNLVWGIVNKICTVGFPFVIRTIIIWTLGVEYLGLSSLFTSIVQVLSLAELGISSAIVFSMYEPITNKDVDSVCAIYNLYKQIYRIVGTVILVIGLVLIPFIPHLISGDILAEINIYALYIIYLANTVVSYYMSAYKECLLIAKQRTDISLKIATGAYTCMYGLQVVILLLFHNYYYYIILILICTIVVNLVRSYIVDKEYPQYKCRGTVSTNTKKELKKKVMGLMLYKISGVCRNSFDSIVLSAYLGLTLLARYQNYYYIMVSLVGFCGIINTSITASVGQSMVTESTEKNYMDFRAISLLYSWVVGWCTICLLCLYQPFMTIWMGQENLLSFNAVILFCIYFYTLLVADMCYIYRQAAGLWWEDKFRPIIEAILNLVLNIVLVKFFGVVGVLLSTIISIVFLNIPWASYILFSKYFKMPVTLYLQDVLKKAAVVLVASIATYLLSILIPFNGIMSLILVFLICLFVPNFILLFVFKKMNEYSRAQKLVERMVPEKIKRIFLCIF